MSDTRDKKREIPKIQSVIHPKNSREHRESLLHVNRRDSQKDYGSASENPENKLARKLNFEYHLISVKHFNPESVLISMKFPR